MAASTWQDGWDCGLGLSAALLVAHLMRLISVEGEERIRKYI